MTKQLLYDMPGEICVPTYQDAQIRMSIAVFLITTQIGNKQLETNNLLPTVKQTNTSIRWNK